MGNRTSRTVTDVTVEAVNKALAESIMNCTSNTTLKQNIDIVGNFTTAENIKQRQATKISAECIQDANVLSDMQNKAVAAVQGVSDTTTTGILGAIGNTAQINENRIRNEVTNETTLRNIVNAINNTNLEQGIFVNGSYNILRNITQEQTADLLANNMNAVTNQMAFINDLKNSAEGKTVLTEKGALAAMFDTIGDSLSNLFSSGTIVIVAILIGGIAFVYIVGPQNLMKMLGMDPGSDSLPPPPPPPPQQQWQPQQPQQQQPQQWQQPQQPMYQQPQQWQQPMYQQ